MCEGLIDIYLFDIFQAIMKDKWMNMGFEEEDLKPYIEPVQDWADIKRIEILTVGSKFRFYNLKKYILRIVLLTYTQCSILKKMS